MPFKDSAARKAYDQRYYQDHKHKIVERTITYREGHKDQLAKARREWLSEPVNRVAQLVRHARTRAKRDGIKCDINVDDLTPVPAICPVLGIPLDYGSKPGRQPTPNSPSLDRSDSNRGYVKGNVRIISYRANVLKNNATVAELRKVLKYVSEAV